MAFVCVCKKNGYQFFAFNKVKGGPISKSKADRQLRIIFDIISSLGFGIFFFSMYQDFKRFNDITAVKLLPFLYTYLYLALKYKTNLS